MTNKSKFRGCLYGGAIGDALGYPIEFRSAEEIFTIYGKDGIQDYELFYGKAYISDDTQMTLFTANGLLNGYTKLCLSGRMTKWEEYVRLAYQDWLTTQSEKYGVSSSNHFSWLLNEKQMYAQRVPGNTCLSALESQNSGSIKRPINSSKGCGGVMRVAPVGLYLPKHMENIEEIDKIGAEVAAITHGHPLGYIPAAALAHIIAKCTITNETIEVIVKDAIQTVTAIFQSNPYIHPFRSIMEKAVTLAQQSRKKENEKNSIIQETTLEKQGNEDTKAIHKIGQGWVAEETLAIAVYCAIKYQDNFTKAVTAAVNHNGDSDSTGAVTGNIMGAYLGIEKIPEKYIQPLELKEVIDEIANDLYEDCKIKEYNHFQEEKWIAKYVEGTYKIDQ